MISYYPTDNNQNTTNICSNLLSESEYSVSDNYEQFKDEVMDSLIIKMKEIEIYKEDKKKFIFYPFI